MRVLLAHAAELQAAVVEKKREAQVIVERNKMNGVRVTEMEETRMQI